MIILHEGLKEEAEYVSESFKAAFGLESIIVDKDLSHMFLPIPKFNGYHIEPLACPAREYESKALFLLTWRDFYLDDKNKEGDWIFGVCWEPHDWKCGAYQGPAMAVSTARMKREDNLPSDSLEISKEQYLKRVALLSVHEVGHDVVKSSSLKHAFCIFPKVGIAQPLGPHCIDSSCALYEVIDVKAPLVGDSFLLIGSEVKTDAGIDDVLPKLHKNYFCDSCRNSIVIDKKYK